MQSTFKIKKEEKAIRAWLILFMSLLVISGLTAIPVEWELGIVNPFFSMDSTIGQWLEKVYSGVHDTGNKYPFLFYGYDWLAFAHVVLAIAFIGPYKDPVRNKWVIEFGMYACLLVIPFALTAGYFRGIPFWWRLCDCSFGLIGLLPLGACYRKIDRLEILMNQNPTI